MYSQYSETTPFLSVQGDHHEWNAAQRSATNLWSKLLTGIVSARRWAIRQLHVQDNACTTSPQSNIDPVSYYMANCPECYHELAPYWRGF